MEVHYEIRPMFIATTVKTCRKFNTELTKGIAEHTHIRPWEIFAALLILAGVGYVQAQCACATTHVHVRSGPGLKYHVFTTIFTGRCLTYRRNGDTIPADGYDWVNVDYLGQSGWIAEHYLFFKPCPHHGVQNQTLDCRIGTHHYVARSTTYYPSTERGFVDNRGAPLKTLQDFLNGLSYYVSVAMDNHASIPYGTHICIPQLNRKYNKVIDFRVVDTKSTLTGKSYGEIDICVRTRADTHDHTLNSHLTIVVP